MISGSDPRIETAAQQGANLLDLADKQAARTNLGLGNSATRNVGVVSGTVADGLATANALQARAPLESPAFTGNPTAPTPANTDSSGAISTTFFVKNQGYTSNTGTVTSVAFTVCAGLTVSGSPITTAGTFVIGTTLAGMLKGTGNGFTTAVAGTDYVSPNSPSVIDKLTITGAPGGGANFRIGHAVNPGDEPLWGLGLATYTAFAIAVRSNNLVQCHGGLSLNSSGDLNVGNSTNPYGMQRGGSSRWGFGGGASPAFYADAGSDTTTIFLGMLGGLCNNPGSSALYLYLAVGQTAAAAKIADAYNNILTSFGPQGWLAIGKSTLPTAPLDVVGNARATHFFSSGTAPTIGAGPAAGTTPTVSISGTDHDGLISITIGTSPASGILATITFGSAFSSTPMCPVIGPATANAWASGVYVDPTSTSTSVWKLKCDMALMTGVTFKFAYHVGA